MSDRIRPKKSSLPMDSTGRKVASMEHRRLESDHQESYDRLLVRASRHRLTRWISAERHMMWVYEWEMARRRTVIPHGSAEEVRNLEQSRGFSSTSSTPETLPAAEVQRPRRVDRRRPERTFYRSLAERETWSSVFSTRRTRVIGGGHRRHSAVDAGRTVQGVGPHSPPEQTSTMEQ